MEQQKESQQQQKQVIYSQQPVYLLVTLKEDIDSDSGIGVINKLDMLVNGLNRMKRDRDAKQRHYYIKFPNYLSGISPINGMPIFAETNKETYEALFKSELEYKTVFNVGYWKQKEQKTAQIPEDLADKVYEISLAKPKKNFVKFS